MGGVSKVLRAERPAKLPDKDTLGGKLHARRLELGLTQTEASKRIGVCPKSLVHWETNTKVPADRLYPAMIAFLGYEPWPFPRSLSERLVAERRRRGLSRDRAAAIVGVDEEVLRRWETGEWAPSCRTAVRLRNFLAGWVSPEVD